MTTRFDKKEENIFSIDAGYEGDNHTYDYTIPSCGLEDVDKSVFNLFDREIPLYYTLDGERRKVPVIFATGERFAILRRKQPIIDRKGALILPLISINRTSIENVPSKGRANNEMLKHVITNKLSSKDMEYRQLNNPEGFKNAPFKNKDNLEVDSSLKSRFKDNIIETIEMPPVKSFGVVYDITVWSSFTSQMNKLLETIISAYTINPGQQFKLTTDKGYWFPAFVDSSFSPETSYTEFTDSERYIKTSFTINATGYLILPNIDGGKRGLRSYMSAPEVSFEVNSNYVDIQPQVKGIQDSSTVQGLFDDLTTEDDYVSASGVGVNPLQNRLELESYDGSKGVAVQGTSLTKDYDRVGEWNSEYTRTKKVAIRKEDGSVVHVKTVKGSKGETVYDQKMADILFNITTNK
jgi:hypothetical protein